MTSRAEPDSLPHLMDRYSLAIISIHNFRSEISSLAKLARSQSITVEFFRFSCQRSREKELAEG